MVYGDLMADIAPYIDHGVFETVKLRDFRLMVCLPVLFHKFSDKKIKPAVDVGDIFAGAGFVVDISDTFLKKIIVIIVKDQMLRIQSGHFKQFFCLAAEESDPADIPGIILVGGMDDGALRQDQKTIAFFQGVLCLLCAIDSRAFCDVVDQIIIPLVFTIAVIGLCGRET